MIKNLKHNYPMKDVKYTPNMKVVIEDSIKGETEFGQSIAYRYRKGAEIVEVSYEQFYLDTKTDNDLILSATAGFLLKALSPRVGGLNYISSEIDTKTGELKRICFRENKVEIFRRFFPDERIDNFYTDSLNDGPMIEISKNAYMVKGTKIEKIK